MTLPIPGSFKRLAARMAGNVACQRLLARNVAISHYLMGIGTGSSLASSGESVLIERLAQGALADQPLCIFDVGANVGHFIRLIIQRLDVPFHVHAFEPSQPAYRMLCDNTKGHSNLTLNNVGLGKQPGTADLYADQPGSSLASLYQRRLRHHGIEFKYSEKIRMDTLDDYCAAHAIQRIDLLKLDVEGHELDVLQGGTQLFRARRIRMVSFEFGNCNIDARTFLQDFWYFFREQGMNGLFRITPSGYLTPIQKYDESHEQFRTSNFLVTQGTP